MSRVLAATFDFDLRRSHAEDRGDKELQVIYETDRFTEVKKLEMERLRDALPLHRAAPPLTDGELKAFSSLMLMIRLARIEGPTLKSRFCI